jgi:hypothetical protein
MSRGAAADRPADLETRGEDVAQEDQGTNGKIDATTEKDSAAAEDPTPKKGVARKKGTSRDPESTKGSGATRGKAVAEEKAAEPKVPEPKVPEPKRRTVPKKPAAPGQVDEPGKSAGGKKVKAGKKSAAPDETPASQSTSREQPAATASEEPGREPLAENPIHRKLGLRPESTGLVIAPPEDSDNPLLPLPEGFSVLSDVEALSSFDGQVDYLHFFARNRGELARVVVLLRDKLAPGGSLWVSWIKQSSSRRGEGLPGDLNENVIRRLALTSGLVDVKVAALDHDWSALKLVHRRH